YGQINPYGFVETPYRKVYHKLKNNDRRLIGQTLSRDVKDEAGKLVAAAQTEIAEALFGKLAKLDGEVQIVPWVSQEVVYLTADDEERFVIAQANAPLDAQGHFLSERISAREGLTLVEEAPSRMDYMDVSPRQMVSVAAALIPFLEHDDVNRALMGANMQRQAVPLLRPQAPIVGTGVERQVAIDSGQVVIAEADGEVVSATARGIVIVDDEGVEHAHKLRKFVRSNQGTCINQRPIVNKGDRVHKGQPIADSS